ncbi:sensor domain-containing diguanylate cyclase [Singulisphaera acidiphila]|uniref:diguanylate cyclase n=1 Tax=Singulisphaera acidiphila (strain ATCC BAA-1392 / DSM 18658 / VKM B-2454 / MOB10) TaxID=886293 RepID=L0DEY8_SINAD|nr:sensor domain-containing diguanylate cyclase [Singulisphaera acidiphila]AGA27934.1 diguanylate cyclase (GGDEF) domain-containing protein [Singulisphaera acidiphila DSM 18658]
MIDKGDVTAGIPGLAESLDLMPLGACVIDVDMTVRVWNRTLVEWTGIPREEALGMDLAERFPGLRGDRIGGRLRQVFEAGTPTVFSAAIHKQFLAVPTRHGPPGSLMVQQTQVRRLPGQSTLALITIGDVTSEAFQLTALRAERTRLVTIQAELLRLMKAAEADRIRVERLHAELQEAHVSLGRKNAELAELAATDALTGLANRRRFREVLESAFALAIREGLPLSLMMLDIDEFKKYNDEYGHIAGDEVLRGMAVVFDASLRMGDTAARYGGEEFVVLLPMTDSRSARTVAERLRTDIEHHAWPLRQVTSSFGVVTLGPSSAGAAEFLNQADRALYHSKRRGRNCISHYEDLASFAAESDGATGTNPPAPSDLEPLSHPDPEPRSQKFENQKIDSCLR